MTRSITMGLVALAFAAAAPAQQDGLVVEVEFRVTDGSGRPVTDLAQSEVQAIHGAEKQQIASFQALPRAGHYELSYAPLSGESAPVYLRCARPGARLTGPGGGPLKPRLVVPASADETAQDAELAEALAVAPEDFRFQVSVFQFEENAVGLHHTVGVQVHLGALPPDPSIALPDGRLKILAQIVDSEGAIVHRIKLDQPLELGPHASQDFVWTGDVHLPPGPYELSVLVRELSLGRSALRTLSFDSPPATTGLRMSSVVLLQPREVIFFRAGGDDDPLYVGDEPVMPNLNVVLPLGTDAPIRFFVVLYPDAASLEPPSLKLELARQSTVVGSVPLELPDPEPSGEIRYVGLLATGSLQGTTYTLRLVASQGDTTVSDHTDFEMLDWRNMPRTADE